MSRTLIVGLLPAQAKSVFKSFPNNGLKFLSKEQDHRIGDLVNGFDNVVVMTKFISHSSYSSVPKDKLHHVSGGLTDLKRTILKVTKQLAEKPMSSSEAIEASEFSQIRDAAPGTVLRFTRPRVQTLEQFKRNVMATRSYYKRRWNIHTEQRDAGEGEGEGQVVFVTVNGCLPSATAEQGAPDTTVQDVAAAKFVSTSDADFWQKVYLSQVQCFPTATPEQWAPVADQALAQYQSRFPNND